MSPLRPIQEATSFPLEDATLTDKARAILDAVSLSNLSDANGRLLLDGLAGVVRVQDSEQTAKQLELIRLALVAEQRKVA